MAIEAAPITSADYASSLSDQRHRALFSRAEHGAINDVLANARDLDGERPAERRVRGDAVEEILDGITLRCFWRIARHVESLRFCTSLDADALRVVVAGNRSLAAAQHK